MSHRRFDDQQAAALLERHDSGDTVGTLARAFACDWRTVYVTLERARSLREEQPPPPSSPAPPPRPDPDQCEYCRGRCLNVLTCGRRRRAAAQQRDREVRDAS